MRESTKRYWLTAFAAGLMWVPAAVVLYGIFDLLLNNLLEMNIRSFPLLFLSGAIATGFFVASTESKAPTRHSSVTRLLEAAAMNDKDRIDLEKMVAVMGQAVVSVLVDMRLELLALRLELDERGTVSRNALNRRVEALRRTELPTLTASTSEETLHRFSRLCEQVGLRPKQPPPN